MANEKTAPATKWHKAGAFRFGLTVCGLTVQEVLFGRWTDVAVWSVDCLCWLDASNLTSEALCGRIDAAHVGRAARRLGLVRYATCQPVWGGANYTYPTAA